MSKVKYIIEVDKEVIDIFLTKINEHYIINQYDGEVSICGRVLLSTFKTATPITESDDVVSRQALLRKLNTKTHEYSNGMGFRKEWVELINSLSPVTPKREQGKWRQNGTGYNDTPIYECSQCGRGVEFGSDGSFKSCPYCGAEMKGVKG